MHGATVTKLATTKISRPEIISVTPQMAVQLLEHNTSNRPLSQVHVNRIARQILADKWRFNGDTIKIAETGDVLDGQHRLWAIIEAKRPVETILVRGIAKEAFATIDTISRHRSGGDTLALNGATRYRNAMASALQWLIRWQRKVLEDWKAPQNKIENSDVEGAFTDNAGIIQAVERATALRTLVTPSVMAFAYYIISNRNADLAERMMETLENPAGVGVNDPFYRLRVYFTADHHRRKEPLVLIAHIFKAANAAHKGKSIQALNWRNQGKSPEPFPALEV